MKSGARAFADGVFDNHGESLAPRDGAEGIAAAEGALADGVQFPDFITALAPSYSAK